MQMVRRSVPGKKRYAKLDQAAESLRKAMIHEIFNGLRTGSAQAKPRRRVRAGQPRVSPLQSGGASVPARATAPGQKTNYVLAFMATLLLALLGVHLMINASIAWYWFTPMLLPVLALMGNELEQAQPFGYWRKPAGGFRRFLRFCTLLGLWICAALGVRGMFVAPENWYVYVPLLFPVLIMLPGLMKLVEDEDKLEKQRAIEKLAERRANGPGFGAVVWKIIKIALVVGIVLLLLKFVGFYLLMGIFGMA
jgi:hypothetical protein